MCGLIIPVSVDKANSLEVSFSLTVALEDHPPVRSNTYIREPPAMFGDLVWMTADRIGVYLTLVLLIRAAYVLGADVSTHLCLTSIAC